MQQLRTEDHAIPSDDLADRVLRLAKDGAAPVLERALRMLDAVLQTDGSVLLMIGRGSADLIVTTAAPLQFDLDSDGVRTILRAAREERMIRDAHLLPDLATYPFIRGSAQWRSFRASHVTSHWPDREIVLLSGSMGQPSPEMTAPTGVFYLARAILADEIRLLNEICSVASAPAPVPPRTGAASENESAATVLEFLNRTLITQPRIRSRKGITYHALRRWRGSIKAEQLAALKALKRHDPGPLASRVAEDLAAFLDSSFGTVRFDTVTNVPCGNSGPGCLAERTAIALAERIGIAHHPRFDLLSRRGSSHPKANVDREPMMLRDAADGQVLLIDDVATSGAHMEEAARRLREAGVSAFALVWLADG